MKISSLLLLLISINAHAINKGVYNHDDRSEYSQVSSTFQTWADATAMQVKNSNLHEEDSDGYIKLSLYVRKMCDGERFQRDPIVGGCSGFMLTPDILITAGHCIQTEDDCKNNSWIFNFHNQREFHSKIKFNDIYKCQEIISQKQDRNTGVDYAIIRLDRSNSNITPLIPRITGVVPIGKKVMVIGYPSGRQLTITPNGTVLRNSSLEYFLTDLDAFHGNSGSPVLDQESGILEGLLVRGGKDYDYDEEKKCYRVHRCTTVDGTKNCRGEDVQRISTVLRHLPPMEFASELLNSNHEVEFKQFIRSYYSNLNITDNENQTILHDVLLRQNVAMTEFLINRGSIDFTIRDSNNFSVLDRLIMAAADNKKFLPLLKQVINNDPQLLKDVDSDGWSPLALAINQGATEVVEFFLTKKEVDLKQKINSGETLLDLAINYLENDMLDDYSLFEILYSDPRCPKDMRLKNGELAANYALTYGLTDQVLALVDQNIIAPSSLDFSITTVQAYIEGDQELLDKLINNYHISLNFDYQEGLPFLKAVIVDKQYDLLHKIMQQYDDLSWNFTLEDGQSPIVYFINKRQPEFVQYFLQHNYEMLAIRDERGINALDALILANDIPKYQELLITAVTTPGLDINGGDDTGRTALQLAAMQGKQDAIDTLLMVPGIDIHHVDQRNMNAALYAAKYSHWQIFEQLMELGSDLEQVNYRGKNILYFTLRDGKNELFKKYFKQYQFDLNIRYENQANLLLIAIEGHQTDIINRLLASKQINLDAKLTTGDAAIHLAIKDNNLPLVKQLLTGGANAKLVGADGLKPKKLADKLGHKAIKKYIRKFIWQHRF